MKRLRWWIISLTVILLSGMNAGYGRTEGNEPIREPMYKSPRVYTNIDGKVMFKEFFDGLTVTRIEFFDPDSGELLYGSSLQEGRLIGEREGTGGGKFVEDPLNERREIVKNKYFTHSGKTLLVTREHNGELVSYMASLGKWPYEYSNKTYYESLYISVDLKKGRIKRSHRRFIRNNERVVFKRGLPPDTYEELYFHNDGSRTKYEYKLGFLQIKYHFIPAEGGGKLMPYSAYYLRGRLAFTEKRKWKHNFIQGKRNWYTEEIAVYDSQDKLIGKANPVFGEHLYLKKEVVEGRNALQVIRLGQDGEGKVEAMKFED